MTPDTELTPAEYQSDTARFAVYPDDQKFVYPVLGLLEELEELYHSRSDETANEAGDVLWYCAAILRDVGQPLNVPDKVWMRKFGVGYASFKDALRQGLFLAARLAGIAKKQIRDETPPDAGTVSEIVHEIVNLVGEVTARFSSLANSARANIEKLEDRQNRDAIHGSGDHR